MPAKRPAKKASQTPAAVTTDAINEDLGRRVKNFAPTADGHWKNLPSPVG